MAAALRGVQLYQHKNIGSTVKYYVFTSTVSLGTLNGMNNIDKSLSAINYDDNSGANYSFTLTSSLTSVTSGNFSNEATWGTSQFFSGQSFTIANGHTVTLNQNFSVSNLTINLGGVFNNDNATLSIDASGVITNNGGSASSFIGASGKINFVGAWHIKWKYKYYFK